MKLQNKSITVGYLILHTSNSMLSATETGSQFIHQSVWYELWFSHTPLYHILTLPWSSWRTGRRKEKKQLLNHFTLTKLQTLFDRMRLESCLYHHWEMSRGCVERDFHLTVPEARLHFPQLLFKAWCATNTTLKRGWFRSQNRRTARYPQLG